MPDMDVFLGPVAGDAAFRDDTRPVDMARKIDDKNESVVLYRNNVAQAAQTMRLESVSGVQGALKTEGGVGAGFTGVLLYGYKDHPTIADTDIQLGDRLSVDGVWYVVNGFLPNTPPHIVAFATAVQ